MIPSDTLGSRSVMCFELRCFKALTKLITQSMCAQLLGRWDRRDDHASRPDGIVQSSNLKRHYGPTRVNCRSSVRCRAEKLSSEINVKTISPAGVW